MAYVFRYLILISCAWLSAPWLLAQTTGPERFITLRFTAHAVSSLPELVLFEPKTNDMARAITFYTSARSPVYDYVGTNPVVFFNEALPVNPGEPMQRKMIAQAMVPESVTQPLFIFFKNPAAENDAKAVPFLVYVFDDSAANLPPGQISLINVSGLEFAGRFNDQVLPIKAGLTPHIILGRSAHIELRTQVAKRYYQSYASTQTLTARERALMLLLPPFNKGSVEVQVRILKGRSDQTEKMEDVE